MKKVNRYALNLLFVLIVLIRTGTSLHAQSEANDNYDYCTMADRQFDYDSFSLTRSDLAAHPDYIYGKETSMSEVRKSFPAGDDGLVVIIRNDGIRSTADNNTELFTFYQIESGIGSTVIRAYFSDNTLELRRFRITNTDPQPYYNYKLYDKLFTLNGLPGSNGAALSYEIRIFIKGSFIWVEVKNLSNPALAGSKPQYAHSPIYWGMNDPGGAGNNMMTEFLQKNSKRFIGVYRPFINENNVPVGERIPFLRVASFKSKDLLADLNVRYTKGLGSAGSGGSAKGINAPVTSAIANPVNSTTSTIQPVSKTGGENNNPEKKFSLAPNPVKSGAITITSNLQRSSLLDISINDSRGVQLYHTAYQAIAGLMNKQISLPAALGKGIYYVSIKTTDSAETLKLVVN